MKIDLHCHTKKTKQGDGKARNVTPELFRKKIELADVKIVAITNHNAFDYEQYQILQSTVQDICQVWPGVEIDVIGESRYHLIVVTKPDEAFRFSGRCVSLFSDISPDLCQLSLQEVYETFKDFDAIYIPHFHDKKPAISEADKQELFRIVKDSSRVFIEPRNYRTLGVLANKDMSVLIGSDVKDWNKYESSTFAELRLPVASFMEFLLLAKRDKAVVETLLSKKSPLKVLGMPHHSVKLPLMIYPDVNIIFGQKGTGKTEILKSMYTEVLGSGKKCKKYIASERSEDFSELLNIKDMEISLEKLNTDSCESEFKELSSWTDDNPTSFSSYIYWYQTKGNSNNKSRMKITEAIHDFYRKPKMYDIHENDKKEIQSVLDKIKHIDCIEYLLEEEIKQLEYLLIKLHRSIQEKRKFDLVEKYASRLTNFTIDRIKAFADRSSDTMSRPSTSGLKEFTIKRTDLLRCVNQILGSIKVPDYNERIRLGSLEGKGEIYINCKYRMLCQEERTKNYPGFNITSLKEIVKLLEEIKKHVFDFNIATYVEQLVTLCKENKVTSIKPFVGRSKQIITSDGVEYEPSNGEKGILLLEQVLYEDADIYFLDEPELGMGNSYIDSDIRPLISNLAKQRKYVVVATHNANIAVRTLPYMSIYRTHKNGKYETYLGNPFDDQLVSIADSEDIKSWTEESMHSLEGGYEAFYERRDIYEARNN
ncbi:MAG TPA: histidinol phosphatase [Proteiniclasticum sp.]|uniref:histidinol phosphatase n=1 Tax=Proteiniclasticum sp. TaxID=2053595 RepID=UPI000E94CB60|nr:histidinol phosphatase [Proteiniclasticum sp.]HBW13294.1 histidinol phosphatase [Proteiniclasticum sp.]